LSLSSQTLRAAGLSANKAASMRDLATKVRDGSVVLDPARPLAGPCREAQAHRLRHLEMGPSSVEAV